MDSAVEFREHWHCDWESWTIYNLLMRSGSHTEVKIHKIKERERPYQELYFIGKQVCRKSFCFMHNIEKKCAVRQELAFTRCSCEYWKISKVCTSICRYKKDSNFSFEICWQLLTMLCLSQKDSPIIKPPSIIIAFW